MTPATLNRNLWLYRTKNHELLGPVSGQELRNLVLGCKLGAEDEICPANGYWMALHETEEVERFLGVVPPFARIDPTEATKTAITDTLSGPIPELEETEEEGGTQMHPMQQGQPTPAPRASASPTTSSPASARSRAARPVEMQGGKLSRWTPSAFWKVALALFGVSLFAILIFFLRFLQLRAS